MALKYWFKARKYGVGWTAHTWQGWTVVTVYSLLLIYSFFQVDSLLHFVPRFLLFTALLTVITYLKGEPTSWEAVEKQKDHAAHHSK